MQIPLTKIFLVLMFVFVLFSNVLNYVAIGTVEWIKQSTAATPSVSSWKKIWDLADVPLALIATGTALNILSFILAILSLSSLCIEKVRNSFAVFFVFGCLVTTLLSLLFNTTGWYFVLFEYQKLYVFTSANNASSVGSGYGWSFWLMTACFGCSVLAAVFAACIIGCSFALHKYENQQRRSKAQSPNEVFQVSTKNPSLDNNEGYYSVEGRPVGVTTSYSYQNEVYQNEQRVLRL